MPLYSPSSASLTFPMIVASRSSSTPTFTGGAGNFSFIGSTSEVGAGVAYVPTPFQSVNDYDTDIYGIDLAYDYTNDGVISMVVPGIYSITAFARAQDNSAAALPNPDWRVQFGIHTAPNYEISEYGMVADGDDGTSYVQWSWMGTLDPPTDTSAWLFAYIESGDARTIRPTFSITVMRLDV